MRRDLGDGGLGEEKKLVGTEMDLKGGGDVTRIGMGKGKGRQPEKENMLMSTKSTAS